MDHSLHSPVERSARSTESTAHGALRAGPDGLADVLVIEAASPRAMMRALPKVYDDGHIELEQVRVLRGAKVEISGSPSVPMGGDGVPLGALPTSATTPAVVEVRPAALRVLS